jgi:ribulose 1,5-bisphosphate synthetase/thiazole synthase
MTEPMTEPMTVEAERDRYLAVVRRIAQYDMRWMGQHVNDSPSRQRIIEWAYDAALDALDETSLDDQVRRSNCEVCGGAVFWQYVWTHQELLRPDHPATVL